MHYKEAVKKLESSKEFNSWKKTHEKAYLVHFFKMLDKVNEKLWQIGYYSTKTNLITVFVINGVITKNKDEKVFQEQKRIVLPLDLSNVTFDEEKVMKMTTKILNENYKGVSIVKSFMILQNIDAVGQVWNITFVTNEFKTVNIKIDSKTGECISHKIVSLIQGKD